jgi:hypothetical protein
LASIVQVPPILNVTTPAAMLQTDELVASTVMATVNPEVADAVGV